MSEISAPQIYTSNDTLANKTGSWRFVRPLFGARIAPCALSCPAGNPIAKFMGPAAAGDVKAALKEIKKENPLPSICGRVCPHPCTSSCNRNEFDAPLAINEIERYVGDSTDLVGLCIPEPAPATGMKVAVIGSGPAGLSCAYHSALLGHDVTIFESAKKPGGLLRTGIPAYRLPRAVLDRDLGFIDHLGIELKLSTNVDENLFAQIKEEFDAICLASGAHESFKLGIDGEDSDCVRSGLAFLKNVNSGNVIKPGSKTIVIGGGNTAVDAARCALRLGSEVTLVYRRTREDMPAFEDEIADALEEGVNFKYLAAPLKIKVKGDGPATVLFSRMEPGEQDESGRARPVPIEGRDFSMEADTIITAVGEMAVLEYSGENKKDIEKLHEQAAGPIFICGDAGPNNRTVAHAIGSGKRAAVAINEFLSEEESAYQLPATATGFSVTAYRNRAASKTEAITPKDINVAHLKTANPLEQAKAGVDRRVKGFEEIVTTAEEKEALAEASRCATCGVCNRCGNCYIFCPEMSILEIEGEECPSFDADYCKGCGICARECPRGMIQMTEENK